MRRAPPGARGRGGVDVGRCVGRANGKISRETITVLSGETLEAGAVLGKVTASGKYKALEPAAVDGSEAAAGILYDAVDASSADAEGVAIVRLAEVIRPVDFGIGKPAVRYFFAGDRAASQRLVEDLGSVFRGTRVTGTGSRERLSPIFCRNRGRATLRSGYRPRDVAGGNRRAVL